MHSSPADETLFHLNGVDGSTGDYLVSGLSAEQLLELATDSAAPAARDGHQQDLLSRATRERPGEIALAYGLDARRLAQTGWGVIFPADTDPAVREALAPLLDLRKSQVAAGGRDRYYREFLGPDGHRPGETKHQFLARHGTQPGAPADPECLPYYLLIVGDPERIPFRFQYELDVEYAVGRVCFQTPDEYAQYARSVLAAETQVPAAPRRAVFFGARNPEDASTELSSNLLVRGLADAVRATRPDWQVEETVAEEATKPALAELLGAACPPLLFSATHGMAFRSDDVHFYRHQGALLCSEWEPATCQPVAERYYFSADDVAPDARLLGAVMFHFACYSGGTPAPDDYPPERGLRRPEHVAPRAFLAALPQRLLAHPGGGAGAVIANVGRAWACSFLAGPGQPGLAVFLSALRQLLDGYPVGAAMEWFNGRYAALASELTYPLARLFQGETLPLDERLQTAWLWTLHNDARSYAVFGDPAVRLRAASAAAAAESRSGLGP
jgi:hypothetical protein